MISLRHANVVKLAGWSARQMHTRAHLNLLTAAIMRYDEIMNQFQRINGHLKTINTHKAKVMDLCFRCGLYKQGLLHDLSKYSPLELKTGFKYFQGFRSPIDAQKEAEGKSVSWLHHKGRNMHHWEFWLDNGPDGIHPVPIPFNYIAEMFCDRVAACMIYQKEKYTDASAWEYYEKQKDKVMLESESRKQLEYLLLYLKENGLDLTLALIRQMLKECQKDPKTVLVTDQQFAKLLKRELQQDTDHL